MAIEAPYIFLAGLELSNVQKLKRYMAVILARLYHDHPNRFGSSIGITREEKKSIEVILSKIRGNDLLAKMTTEWASHYDKNDLLILKATKDLKREATNFVIKPKLYRVEYELAEEAFEQGGFVYNGEVVFWDDMPLKEKEVQTARLMERERQRKHRMREENVLW